MTITDEAIAVPKVAFTTLGCPKNEVDTDLMRTALEDAGYYTCEYDSEQPGETDPDIAAIVVNTCSFIQEATEASIEAIFDALNTGDGMSDDTKLPVIVAGCIVNRYADELADEMSEVTALIKVGDTEALLRALSSCVPAPASAPIARAQKQARSFEYLRIADGCNRKCTFCTIPSIRGAYTSRQPDDILAQAENFVTAGTYELIVIAQDIGRYGSDLDTDANLVSLIEQLAEIPKLKRLRLMYLQPEGLTDELLQTMAQNSKVVPYLEIPVQHIAPRVLKAMGRNPKDVQSFETQLTKARELMPELAVRTTLIAGFPGETQEEFDQLCTFVDRMQFDYVGVFPYSPEEGTRAAQLPDQLDIDARLGRAQQLRDVADSIGWQLAADRIGQSAEVLVEGFDEHEQALIARAAFQAPDIDGIVRVELPENMDKESVIDEFFAPGKPNKCLQVEFTDVILYDMDAAIISSGEDVR